MANRFQDYTPGRKAQIICGVAFIAIGGLALLVAYRTTAWLLQARFAVEAVSVHASLVALVAFVVYMAWAIHKGKFDQAFLGQRAGVIHRSREDRRIAGVCGGLSQYYGVDVTTTRIVALLLFFIMPFLAVLAYVLLAAALPGE